MAQLKKGFKSLFSKKPKKEEPTPTASSEVSSPAATKPSETTPAAPAPATAPEPATTSSEPAQPAQPAAVQSPGEPKKDEAAALTEVKKATQSRSTSRSTSNVQLPQEDDYWNGARRRQKIAMDDDWGGPI